MPCGEGAAGKWKSRWKRKCDSFKVVSVQLGDGEGEKSSTRRLISSTLWAPGTEPEPEGAPDEPSAQALKKVARQKVRKRESERSNTGERTPSGAPDGLHYTLRLCT